MRRLHFPIKKKDGQAGFTIVELLISMAVFASIMLIVVSVFLQVSRLYTKGVTVSRTQESARSLLDDLTREIQFSSSPVIGSPVTQVRGGGLNYYCIGGRRYAFKLDVLKTGTPTGGTEALHVLQKDTVAGAGSCPAASPDGDGYIAGATEMMIDNTSLTDLTVQCTPDQVSCDIRIRMTYGDPNDNVLFMDEGNPNRRVCRGGIVGAEFCTVVELSTTVTRRLQ